MSKDSVVWWKGKEGGEESACDEFKTIPAAAERRGQVPPGFSERELR